VFPGVPNIQALGCLPSVSAGERSKQSTEICIEGERTEGAHTLPASVSALRVNHSERGRRLGKLSKVLNLGSEVSVLLSGKPHTAGRQSWKPGCLLVMAWKFLV
jgi:hypothetical protein